ncbi:MAG: tail fiber protein [Rhodocyclaceae bacterium]|nr:tail fiber protein [Rhodocyclaceae bacterium]
MSMIERLAALIAAIGADMRAASPMLGEVRMLAVEQVPDGWVPCDGRLLDVAAYPEAAAALGARWGGDGVTTFGVPDMRGRFPLGAEAADIGGIGGAASVTLSNAHLPAQVTGSVTGQTINGSVTVNALNGDSPPAGGVNIPTGTANTVGKTGSVLNFYPPSASNKIAVPTTHNLSVTGGNVTINGGGEPVPTVPPWAGVGFVVYIGAPVT